MFETLNKKLNEMQLSENMLNADYINESYSDEEDNFFSRLNEAVNFNEDLPFETDDNFTDDESMDDYSLYGKDYALDEEFPFDIEDDDEYLESVLAKEFY